MEVQENDKDYQRLFTCKQSEKKLNNKKLPFLMEYSKKKMINSKLLNGRGQYF